MKTFMYATLVLVLTAGLAGAAVTVSGDYASGSSNSWIDENNVKFDLLTVNNTPYTWTQAGTLTIDRDGKVQLQANGGNDGDDYTLIWDNTGTTTVGDITVTGYNRFELQYDINTTINNSGTWVFDATNETSYIYMYGSTTGVFNNSGLLKKVGGSVAGLTNGPGTFVNTGTIRIEEGSFGVYKDSLSYTDSGTWELVMDNGGADAFLNIDSDDSTLAGDITINLEDGDGGAFAKTEYRVAKINNLDSNLNGYSFLAGSNVDSIRVSGDDVYATPIPEPATMALLGIGGLGVLLKRKR